MNKHHKLLHFIAKVYGAKLVIKPDTPANFGAGEYCNYTKTVFVFDNDDLVEMVSVLFHELGHDYCAKNNLWVNYHRRPANFDEVRKLAVRAELWVDKWAEKEYNRIFPNGVQGLGYRASYRTKETQQQLKDYYRRAA